MTHDDRVIWNVEFDGDIYFRIWPGEISRSNFQNFFKTGDFIGLTRCFGISRPKNMLLWNFARLQLVQIFGKFITVFQINLNFGFNEFFT